MAIEQLPGNTTPNVNADGSGGHYNVVQIGGQDSNGVFHSKGVINNVTVFASAAHTTTQTSSTFTNYWYRGAIIYLDITVASGTGGLTVEMNYVDPLSGATTTQTFGTARTTIGLYACPLYPSASLSALSGGSVVGFLPSNFQIKIAAGDSSSYTYSVSMDFIS